MIPDFDEYGLLPPGIHDCALEDIAARLCFTKRRRQLFKWLVRFIETEWRAFGYALPLLIDGSFTRDKPLPGDIDVAVDASTLDYPSALLLGMQIRTANAEIKAAYNVDLWTSHPQLPHNLEAFFQYVGESVSPELRLSSRHPKGILRVRP